MQHNSVQLPSSLWLACILHLSNYEQTNIQILIKSIFCTNPKKTNAFLGVEESHSRVKYCLCRRAGNGAHLNHQGVLVWSAGVEQLVMLFAIAQPAPAGPLHHIACKSDDPRVSDSLDLMSHCFQPCYMSQTCRW